MSKINIKDIISVKPLSKLKVAHFAKVAPNQAGISGTAIDMVMAERAVGIDAQLLDYEGGGKPCMIGSPTDEITTVGPSWAKKADIIVRHSAIPDAVKATGKPIVMCLHGRPEYGFMLHYAKGIALIDEYTKCVADPQYRTFITFWQQHLHYLKIIMPKSSIDYVPAMVNLDVYKPRGITIDYDTDGGSPNILIADMWREDTSPFNVLVAASLYIKKYGPEARVHIYGLQRINENPVKEVIARMKEACVISQADSIIKHMPQIYRAADILVTPHRIATRTIREALASGLPIVAGKGCRYTPYTADARDTEGFAKEINKCWNSIKGRRSEVIKESRAMAEKSFNLKQAGEAALKVYERIMKKSKPRIELRTKQMIYNFIAYAPTSVNGGMDKDLGGTYNKYMELLGDDEWACFIDHDAMFTTVDWYKQLEKILVSNPEYGCFSAVTNRVGNPEQRLANLKDTHDILYHRAIGRQLQKQNGEGVNDVTNKHCISGVVILVSKKAWKKAGGFKDGFLGVDNDFHQRMVKSGQKVGVMKGLYVYHVYRADGANGLQPVKK